MNNSINEYVHIDFQIINILRYEIDIHEVDKL